MSSEPFRAAKYHIVFPNGAMNELKDILFSSLNLSANIGAIGEDTIINSSDIDEELINDIMKEVGGKRIRRTRHVRTGNIFDPYKEEEFYEYALDMNLKLDSDISPRVGVAVAVLRTIFGYIYWRDKTFKFNVYRIGSGKSEYITSFTIGKSALKYNYRKPTIRLVRPSTVRFTLGKNYSFTISFEVRGGTGILERVEIPFLGVSRSFSRIILHKDIVKVYTSGICDFLSVSDPYAYFYIRYFDDARDTIKVHIPSEILAPSLSVDIATKTFHAGSEQFLVLSLHSPVDVSDVTLHIDGSASYDVDTTRISLGSIGKDSKKDVKIQIIPKKFGPSMISGSITYNVGGRRFENDFSLEFEIAKPDIDEFAKKLRNLLSKYSNLTLEYLAEKFQIGKNMVLDLIEDAMDMGLIDVKIDLGRGIISGAEEKPVADIQYKPQRDVFDTVYLRKELKKAHEDLYKSAPLAPVADVFYIKDKKFRDYDVIGVIGEGGFSIVYKVIKNNKYYALKIPKFVNTLQTVSFELLEKYKREIEIWALLSKKNIKGIVNIVEYSFEPFPWFVMEYVAGGSLRKYIGRYNVIHSLSLVYYVSKTMHQVHMLGIRHFDLKPENILLDLNGMPKIGDFGTAKIELLSTTSSVPAITLIYAAPEQIDSRYFGQPDERTDIYQVGVILYELLTGRPPFVGSPVEIINQKILGRFVLPSNVNRNLPKDVDQIVVRALATKKDERYDTFLEMAKSAYSLIKQLLGK